MNLNCNEADLAFVVRSVNQTNIGRLVKCERIATSWDFLDAQIFHYGGPCWVIDQPLLWTHPDGLAPRWCRIAPDSILRPLRGDEVASKFGEEVDL